MDQTLVPLRIEVSDKTDVIITWDDDTTSTLTARQLRAACQCADCREPAGRERTEAVLAGDEQVRIGDARLVGNYAINFIFEPDGHGTGIFPFPALRALAS
jgi:DUF971 family protein